MELGLGWCVVAAGRAIPVHDFDHSQPSEVLLWPTKSGLFHWHVSGPHFRDYHLLLDDQANEVEATIDELAERVRKIGGTTIRSIGHIAGLQRIKDNEKEFVPPLEMLRELVGDNKALVQRMRKAHKLVDDHDDVATASLLENFIDGAEKRCWFLFEASRDADRSGH